MAKTTQPSAGERDPLLPYPASPPPYLDTHPADSYAVFLVPIRLRRGCGSRCLGPLLSVVALLSLTGFLLWPADPDVSVARLSLEHVSVAAHPAVAITISAALKVRVRNPDLFALDYSRLAVDIGYRGAKLGRATSGGGHVRARAVSYIDADLHLDGIRVVEDAFYLLEDLARGSVPFDTVVEVEGHMRFFFLSIPVKVDARCSIPKFSLLFDCFVMKALDCFP
jgi:LEA14-like dessication related protein